MQSRLHRAAERLLATRCQGKGRLLPAGKYPGSQTVALPNSRYFNRDLQASRTKLQFWQAGARKGAQHGQTPIAMDTSPAVKER